MTCNVIIIDLYHLSPYQLAKSAQYRLKIRKVIEFYDFQSLMQYPLVVQKKIIAGVIALRKLLFLGNLITEPKVVQSVRRLFRSRAGSHFEHQ